MAHLTPECTSHIQKAYADIGMSEPFFYPRDNCIDEPDIDPTLWIPRWVCAGGMDVVANCVMVRGSLLFAAIILFWGNKLS